MTTDKFVETKYNAVNIITENTRGREFSLLLLLRGSKAEPTFAAPTRCATIFLPHAGHLSQWADPLFARRSAMGKTTHRSDSPDRGVMPAKLILGVSQDAGTRPGDAVGACTHWKAPPWHGAHVERTLRVGEAIYQIDL